MKTLVRRTLPLVFAFGGLLAPSLICAQVSYERIRGSAEEPENWLTYNGTYSSQRYSELAQIAPSNVGNLESKWVLQNQVFGAWQSNPIVVDGIMYVTERRSASIRAVSPSGSARPFVASCCSNVPRAARRVIG